MQYSDSLPAVLAGLAAALAQDRTDEELGLLAAIFTQLGDSLTLILAARTCKGTEEA